MAEGALLSTTERMLFLKTVELFARVSPDVLRELAALASEETWTQGEPLLEQGDPGDALYIVVKGEVGIETARGQIATRAAGECIGEIAVLDGEPRTATARAISDVLCLRLDGRDIAELLAERPELAMGVISVLAGKLRETR